MAHSPSFVVEKPHVKFLLYAGVNVALIAVLGSILYGINRVSGDIAAAKQEIETLSLVVSQIAALRDTSNAADAAMHELQRILPGTDQLLFISTELEALASRFTIQFGFQYGATDEGPPRAILFTMSLEGPLLEVARYIEALATEFPYIMQISNLDVVGTQGGGYRAILAGRIFIR